MFKNQVILRSSKEKGNFKVILDTAVMIVVTGYSTYRSFNEFFMCGFMSIKILLDAICI